MECGDAAVVGCGGVAVVGCGCVAVVGCGGVAVDGSGLRDAPLNLLLSQSRFACVSKC